MREEISSLIAEPSRAAMKGWKVSTTKALRKGCPIGGAEPLLVHQTLGNRDEVLVCALCHRFVGTEATQLAMLQGLDLHGRNLPYSDSETTLKQKRLRTEFPSSRGIVRGGGDCTENPANVVRHRSWSTGGDDRQSRRLLVASAPMSDLPSLPRPSAKKAHIVGRIGEKKGGSNDDDGGGITVAVREVYRCERGAPCDEVYCSVRCRRMALEAGHALICVGGSGEVRFSSFDGTPSARARRTSSRRKALLGHCPPQRALDLSRPSPAGMTRYFPSDIRAGILGILSVMPLLLLRMAMVLLRMAMERWKGFGAKWSKSVSRLKRLKKRGRCSPRA